MEFDTKAAMMLAKNRCKSVTQTIDIVNANK